MQKSKSMGKIKSRLKSVDMTSVANVLTIGAFIFGIIALLMLVYYFVRPIKTAEIKVPVATDQATYAPGDQVAGIFFGEIYYQGEVRVLREVFCSDNYKRIIPVPAEAEVEKGFYSTQSEPKVIEGVDVPIGKLPSDIPLGSNCVIKFTNVYRIHTPFGIRRIEYNYYTQNFAIVSDDRRNQLDCEATGKEDCDFIGDQQENNPDQAGDTTSNTAPPEGNSSAQSEPQSVNNDNSTTNNTTNNTQPPVQPTEEKCIVNFIVKIGCGEVVAD